MYQTNTIRNTQLEVEHYGHPGFAANPVRKCIMEIKIPNTKAGDIYSILGQFQVTHELQYAVEIARKLTWEHSTGGISGKIILPEAGHNVSPQVWQGQTFPGMHHGCFSFCSHFQMPYSIDHGFISLVVYAGGSSYTKLGDMVSVDSYGQITAVKIGEV